ncbi:MAG: MoxR family ATPase [Ruminococcus sp.]|nr:MoxR family ATPase [Ruminococcus sp.]
MPMTNMINNILNEVNKAVIGKEDITLKVLMAIIAGGHILIDDIPGVGKTTMAMTFSKALGLQHNRMQFTPDVLPTDITGFSVFNQSTGKFEYKTGVAVCNLFLADEINRTSSKTQSALLEIMEEKKITADGKSYNLPAPYIVIATQNPVGSVGTQMLPESQLDRFMIKLSMGYPSHEAEIDIIKKKKTENTNNTIQVADANKIISLQNIVESIYVDDRIYDYMVRLADATRKHPMIKLGLSPRGTISLCAMSKAAALVNGRNYVIPDDVKMIFTDVAAHRIVPENKARLSGMTSEKVTAEIIRNVPLPKLQNLGDAK